MLSYTNVSGYIVHVAIFCWMVTVAFCLVARYGLWLGSDLVFSSLMLIYTYFHYFQFSLYQSLLSVRPKLR